MIYIRYPCFHTPCTCLLYHLHAVDETCRAIELKTQMPSFAFLNGIYVSEKMETVLYGNDPSSCYMSPYWRRPGPASSEPILTATTMNTALKNTMFWTIFIRSARYKIESSVISTDVLKQSSSTNSNAFTDDIFALLSSKVLTPRELGTSSLWIITNPTSLMTLSVTCGQLEICMHTHIER